MRCGPTNKGTSEGLAYEEAPVPEPGTGDVLVRVHAASFTPTGLITCVLRCPTFQDDEYMAMDDFSILIGLGVIVLGVIFFLLAS